EAPRMKEVRFEGGKAIVTFTGDRELGPDYRPIQGFEIAGADKVFIPARAVFGSSLWEVVVSSEIVPEPVAVRYGFRNVPKATSLTSTTGLPAFPFRSDNWDDAR
ncbi:MAG: sialate O-acetylesterase, partial [Alistipes sp.]|nr:sialate O-acetylesterase [Alistipes sp.]